MLTHDLLEDVTNPFFSGPYYFLGRAGTDRVVLKYTLLASLSIISSWYPRM